LHFWLIIELPLCWYTLCKISLPSQSKKGAQNIQYSQDTLKSSKFLTYKHYIIRAYSFGWNKGTTSGRIWKEMERIGNIRTELKKNEKELE